MKKSLLLTVAAVVLLALTGACSVLDVFADEVNIEGATYGVMNPESVLHFSTADTGVLTEIDDARRETTIDFEYTYDPAKRSGTIYYSKGDLRSAAFSISRDGEKLFTRWSTTDGGTRERTFYLE